MRVITLVDMDCFYCQVEEKLNPELQGKPVAVVQYNLWREGGIIAANYLAKEKGVTKGMWKHKAKDLCPEIQFARVAELRGRADLTKYREAGNQVVDVLSTFPILLERASIDEAYLDLTEAVKTELSKGISSVPLEKLQTTHIVGHKTADFISSISSDQDTDGFCEDDLKLAIGGIIVEKMRSSIYEKTGYRCSAGIAQNKILAKLVCGLHKPNKQTILPGNAIPQFLSELPLKKIKRLGGKFGKKVSEELNIHTVGELFNFSLDELIRKFDSKVGHWLHNIARGIDNDPVQPKLLSKSISCCKRFPGKNALFQQKDVDYWINELALEVAQRLANDQEQNNRRAKMATVSFVQCVNSKDVNVSKTFALRSYEASIIGQEALDILKKNCHKTNGLYYLKYLGISVGNFESLRNTKDIKYFFQKKKVEVEIESNNGNETSVCLESKKRQIETKHGNCRVKNIKIFFGKQNEQLGNERDDMNLQAVLDSNCKNDQLQDNELEDINYFFPKKNEKVDRDLKGENSSYCNDKNKEGTEKNKNCDTENVDDLKIEHFESPSSNCNKIVEQLEELDPLEDMNYGFIHGTDNKKENIRELKTCQEVSGEHCSSHSDSGEEFNEDDIKHSFFIRYFNAIAKKKMDHCEMKISPSIQEEKQCSSLENLEDNDGNDSKDHKCIECGMTLHIDELSSHMDYHFALKIQEQDTSIGNENFCTFSNHSLTKHKIGIVDNGSLIATKHEKISEEATQECEICHQEIKISEILSHSDYHTAKNLQQVWNAENKSSTRKNEVKSGNSILRYFEKKTS